MFTLIISDCILIGAVKKLILLSRSVPVIKMTHLICLPVWLCLCVFVTTKC